MIQANIIQLNRVIDQIQSRPERNYSLSDLADIACYSRYHFQRLFTAAFGESPGIYLRRQRIKKSLGLLLHNPDLPITEIAFQTGFSSSANYSKAFKIVTGMTPRSCRKLQYEKIVAQLNLQDKVPDFNHLKTFCAAYNWENAVIEAKPSAELCYLRYQGPYNWKLGLHWLKLIKRAGKEGLLSSSSRAIFGIPHDNPHLNKPDQCIYDACLQLEAPLPENTRLLTKQREAGTYALFPYQGSFDHLDRVYGSIFGFWMEDRGYEPTQLPLIQKFLSPPKGNSCNLELWVPVKPV